MHLFSLGPPCNPYPNLFACELLETNHNKNSYVSPALLCLLLCCCLLSLLVFTAFVLCGECVGVQGCLCPSTHVTAHM